MFALKGVGKKQIHLKNRCKTNRKCSGVVLKCVFLGCDIGGAKEPQNLPNHRAVFFGDLILTCFSTHGMYLYQHQKLIMFFLKGTCFGLVVPMHLKLLFLIILDMFFWDQIDVFPIWSQPWICILLWHCFQCFFFFGMVNHHDKIMMYTLVN